jgi:hypothetical protein
LADNFPAAVDEHEWRLRFYGGSASGASVPVD